jgi:signal transduction histidine kinase
LVQAIVERTSATTPGQGVRVTIGGEIPQIVADPSRIEQVLDNLLANAAKYGDPGTDIQVRVERREGDAVVTVTNRGRGIAPGDMPKIFTRFYRTPEAQAGKVTGLGLGLYIAKGLVEAHGGRIGAESTPGQTTTFTFSLPVRPVAR